MLRPEALEYIRGAVNNGWPLSPEVGADLLAEITRLTEELAHWTCPQCLWTAERRQAPDDRPLGHACSSSGNPPRDAAPEAK